MTDGIRSNLQLEVYRVWHFVDNGIIRMSCLYEKISEISYHLREEIPRTH